MDDRQLEGLLLAVQRGEVSPKAAALKLRMQPFEDLGYARVDHHRAIRQGVAEVVYCAGKTPEQTRGIAERMLENGAKNILLTRAGEDTWRAVEPLHAGSVYHPQARIIVLNRVAETAPPPGVILVVTGGTSDLPVAEEAAITAEVLGNKVERLYDVGVAGLHRLLGSMERIMRANVLIAVAGMEGALPSVVGGLTSRPVIAVPTSVGYGANLGGVAALLTMLNSCASGISVVNIDNGFGAGYQAAMINRPALVSDEQEETKLS